VNATVLTTRFACKLAALVALAWCGWDVTPALGIAFPLVFAALWGLWVAPKARRRLPDPLRFGLELLLFAVATAAFVSVHHAVVAAVFAVAAVVSALLTRRVAPV
jgi:hypothetical protein